MTDATVSPEVQERVFQLSQQSEMFCRILDVSLVNKKPTSASDRAAPCFLPELAEVAVDADLPAKMQRPRLTQELVDVAIIERINLPFGARVSVLRYFMECYDRANAMQNELRGVKNEKERMECLVFIKEQIILYCCRVIDSGILDTAEKNKSLVDLGAVLEASYNERRFPKGFFDEFASQVEEPEAVFEPFLKKIIGVVTAGATASNYAKALNALAKLCENSTTAALIQGHPLFSGYPADRASGHLFARRTILGAFLWLGHEEQSVFMQYFNGLKSKSEIEKTKSVERFRALIGGVVDGVQTAVGNLFRADPKGADPKTVQNTTIAWLSAAIDANHSRGKMHFRPQTVASESFAINLSALMLRQVDPIVRKARDNLIDARVFASDALVKFSKMTHFGTRDECKIDVESLESPNLATKLFCLTHAALNIGWISSCGQLKKLSRHLSDERRQREQAGNTDTDPRLEMLESRIIALHSHLNDAQLVRKIMAFYDFTAKWLVSQVQSKNPMVPLLPEFLVQNIVDFFEYVLQDREMHYTIFQQQSKTQLEHFYEFALNFMSPSSPLANYHLRGRFLDLFRMMLPRDIDKTHKNKTHPFNSNPRLKAELVPTMVTLYVEIENSDRHSTFYEKFPFRDTMARTLKFCLKYDFHQKTLATFVEAERSTFNKFINVLLNDTIFLVDDGLATLRKINQLERAKKESEAAAAAAAAAAAMSDSAPSSQASDGSGDVKMEDADGGDGDGNADEEDSRDLENKARWAFQMLGETLQMITWLAEHHTATMLLPNFVDRFAKLLDSIFLNLVEKEKRKLLKVANPIKKYFFDVKELLTFTSLVFISLSSSTEFLKGVATDKASYSDDVLKEAVALLRKLGLVAEAQVAKFEAARLAVRDLVEDVTIEPDDAPMEFLDALTYELMSDPYEIPGGHVIDYATLDRILMDSQQNPFNRQPLAMEQATAQPELKQRIKEWRQQIIAELRQKAAK